MIAYHEGNGTLVPIASSIRTASDVHYDDSTSDLHASNVQDAIVRLKAFFETKFPGWIDF